MQEERTALTAEEVLNDILGRPAELRQEQKETAERYETLYMSCFGSGIRYDKDRVQTSPDQGDGRLCDIADLERQLSAMPYRIQAAKATVAWLMDTAGVAETAREMMFLRCAGWSIRQIADNVGAKSPSIVHRALASAKRKMLAQMGAHLFVTEGV